MTVGDKPLDFKMNQLLHGAFKRELVRITAGVVALADDPELDATGLVQRWNFFSEQLEHHHMGEDKYLWPLAQERSSRPEEQVVLTAMEAEHAALSGQLHKLDVQFADLGAGRSVDLAQMRSNLVELTTILVGHCQHEERDATKVLQRHIRAADLDEFHKYTRSGPDAALVFPWICDGATQDDQTAAWDTLPWFVRLVAKPVMTRKYQARKQTFDAIP
ncbi:MAG: hemerythrin domain-containing protein [Actinomycetia bacterium]|nr:hemerythrin domain-containing protein [Actinomycetes bacterium]